MKSDKEVRDLMLGFAPHSNLREDGSTPEDKYDIFITTDAYNEGVNYRFIYVTRS